MSTDLKQKRLMEKENKYQSQVFKTKNEAYIAGQKAYEHYLPL